MRKKNVPDMLVALDFGNAVDLNSVESRRSRGAMTHVRIVSERIESADLLGEDDTSGDDDSELQKLVVENSELKIKFKSCKGNDECEINSTR